MRGSWLQSQGHSLGASVSGSTSSVVVSGSSVSVVVASVVVVGGGVVVVVGSNKQTIAGWRAEFVYVTRGTLMNGCGS